MKKTLYGAHGTCETHANSIYEEGFKTNIGRHGKGVYLWQVDKNDEYSWKSINDLTECYLNDTDSQRKKVPDPTHVILRCQVDVSDDNFYDFECHEHSALFAKYRKYFEQNCLKNEQKKLDRSDSSSQNGLKKYQKEMATKVYNGFFAMLEKSLGKPLDIYVYFVKAQKPKSYESMTSIMVGYTVGCYVVKKPSIITIIKKDVL